MIIGTDISTYIINLRKRPDRKQHILSEFSNKDQFNISVVEAIEHDLGKIGLWKTIREIVQHATEINKDKILICEDDHLFTDAYSKKTLLNSIEEGTARKADILCGGVSWFLDALRVSEQLYWTNKFSGTQFMIIFKCFFEKVLQSNFEEGDSADYKICSLTNRAFFIYPFISIQKDFGYSDATSKNNVAGRVESLFINTMGRLEHLEKVRQYFEKLPANKTGEITYDKLTIPTYVINLPERTERLVHINKQFEGKPEFDVIIIEASKHKIGAVGLWLSIRKIIQLAVDNDDDVIILCEDDHEFTPEYSRDYLFKNILEAHQQGADYLSGGTNYFENAIPVSRNRYWLSACRTTQFIIVYKDFFREILDVDFDDNVTADGYFSNLAQNKMALYPSISRQKDFGYSDCTRSYNEQRGLVQQMFNKATERFNAIDMSYKSLVLKQEG